MPTTTMLRPKQAAMLTEAVLHYYQWLGAMFLTADNPAVKERYAKERGVLEELYEFLTSPDLSVTITA